MKFVIGSDHAGFDLKVALTGHLTELGHEVTDLGPDTSAQPASYVPPAVAAGDALRKGEADQAVLICGTGLGISMAANKVDGIRAALCTNEYMARMAREHNDANALVLGARVVAIPLAISILDAYLSGSFEAGGRHQARVEEVNALQNPSDTPSSC